jgi:AbrB family looped-hinge helix DNA binding protein
MPTVDSKGRIVLPKEVREQLGITPGSEVEIHEEEGRVVVEPGNDPDEIIERMEALLAEIPDERDQTPYRDLDPQSRSQVDAIRRQAAPVDSEDEDE